MTGSTLDVALDRIHELTGHRARRNGDGWVTYCPVHERDGRKHRPSLSVREGADGVLLAHCFAGCGFEDVASALGPTGTTTVGIATDQQPEDVVETLWNPGAHRRWFEACGSALLDQPEAPGVGHARRYLRSRGITSDDCRRLGIGFYSPPVVGDPPPSLSGEARHDLARVSYMVVYTTGPTSVEGRIVAGLEPHVHPSVKRLELDKAYSAGPKRWWGVDDATGDEVAIVEGFADRIALERVGIPAVAVRGQSTNEDDVLRLAHAGVERAYIVLDASAKTTAIERMARVLSRHGITPLAMFGHRPEVHPGTDLGDLLKLCDEDELWSIIYGTGQHRNQGVMCTAL